MCGMVTAGAYERTMTAKEKDNVRSSILSSSPDTHFTPPFHWTSKVLRTTLASDEGGKVATASRRRRASTMWPFFKLLPQKANWRLLYAPNCR